MTDLGKKLSPAEKVMALAADNLSGNITRASPWSRGSFNHRGLSDRVIDALIASGMDVPERLLFMEKTALASIPGIGPKGRAELESYRCRFRDVDPKPRAGDPKPTGPATDAVDAMHNAIERDRRKK